MKLIFTILFVFSNLSFAFSQALHAGQKNNYREAVNLYRQDKFMYTGTVYGIYQVPVGTYREQVMSSRGWGIGVENRVTFLKWESPFKPIYNVSAIVNRWNRNGSLGTDIMLVGQVGVNYIFPTLSETIKPYVQGLLGIGAAGSYLTQNRGYSDEINHQGLGKAGTIGTGIYINRFNVGLTYNFFNATLKNETVIHKNMNSVQIRVGARL